MRLTLRTLLAHLDNTLDAEDNAAIASKLKESPFASNLVTRINAVMQNNIVGAPSVVSTSPADDPNRVGEYLDSVLSSEQVAEIERICLESDPHLAEVAACHQVLTLVLGNRAEVSPGLRAKIYEIGRDQSLLDRLDSTSAGTAGSVTRSSSLEIEDASDDAIAQALASHSPAVSYTGSSAVVPVGPDDSGVSDAPTRLRHADTLAGQYDSPAEYSSSSRRIHASEIADFTGRPSRVTPWLVSLALVASFLFVVVQAFSPLLKKRTASRDEATPLVAVDPEALDEEGASAIPDVINKDAAKEDDIETSEDALDSEVGMTVPMVEVDPAVDMPSEAVVEGDEPGTPSLDAVTPGPVQGIVEVTPDLVTEKAPAANEVMPVETEKAMDAAEEKIDPSIAVADTTQQVITGNSKLISDDSLFLVRRPGEENYVLAKKDELIPNGSDLVCPPLYRDQVSIADELKLTMVGPTKLMIEQPDASSVVISPSVGRFMLSALTNAPPIPSENGLQEVTPEPAIETVSIVFGEQEHLLTLIDPDSRVALQVIYTRAAGTDPEALESSRLSLEVSAIQGSTRWKSGDDEEVVLATGEYFRWSPTDEVAKATMNVVPDWIDPTPEVAGSINSSARSGLLSLVRGNESIELSLREAISFRRAEVGSLAAQTLAILDRPSVYFGADGILNDIKQKAYWETHFDAIVSAIDRGPEAATIVREAIEQMDAADSAAIYRMLWLFSNEQLESGSDEVLVSSLDNPNMTVRVLAAENLRAITGTTLFFKPENETPARRSSDIKKWETRLRKGDIRWPNGDAEVISEVPAEGN